VVEGLEYTRAELSLIQKVFPIRMNVNNSKK